MNLPQFKVETFQRPAFMIALGLNPPYTTDDVKQAFRLKVKQAHPDAGGDPVEYMALQEAYEAALDYAKFHAGRSRWIFEEIDRYIERAALIADIESRGGEVIMQRLEGLRPWVGEDFAQMKDKIIAIHLRGPDVTDEALQSLGKAGEILSDLQVLDLAHSQVTCAGLSRLEGLSNLTALDLHDTPINNEVLELLRRFPALEWLHLGGTRINLWGRTKLKIAHPQLVVTTSDT